MVLRLAGFAAINEDRRVEYDAEQQTLEAQEARVIDEYERALREIQNNNPEIAEAAFHGVLSDQLVVDGATEQLQRLRFLSLKNLAGVVASQPGRTEEALDLFARAASEDTSDVALWDRYGTLAAQSGEWAAAKSAFEQALLRDPHHPTVSTKLLQVLTHIGDYARARTFAQMCLKHDPWHSLARRIVAGDSVATTTSSGALLSLPQAHVDITNEPESLISSDTVELMVLEKPTWRHLLRQCAQLLSDVSSATADVKFEVAQTQAPEAALQSDGQITGPSTAEAMPIELPSVVVDLTNEPPTEDMQIYHIANMAAGEAASPPALEAEHNQGMLAEGEAGAEGDGNIPRNEPSVAGTERQLGIDIQGDVDVDEIIILDSEPQEPEIDEDEEAHIETNKEQEGQQGDQGAEGPETVGNNEEGSPDAPLPEKEPEKPAPAAAPTPQRRSGRSTKGRHKTNGPQSKEAAAAAAAAAAEAQEEASQEDPYNLLRTLAPFLSSSDRPDSAQLAERVDDMGAEAFRNLVSADDEAQNVLNSGLLDAPVMSGFQTAVRLLHIWVDPNNAPRLLRYAGASAALLQLVVALEKLQWRGYDLDASQCLLLGELFTDAAGQISRGATATLGGGEFSRSASRTAATHELGLADLEQFGLLWLSRFRAGSLSVTAYNSDGSTNDGNELEIRYWWARGRLHEAASCAVDATGCYRRCAALLDESSNDEVAVPHCSLDSSISASTVAAKLEVLQLHDVLSEAVRLTQQAQHAEVIDVLAPVLLTCSSKEGLMAAVDRRTWLRGLRVLLGAGTAVDDTALVLRCHLRLLRANLPLVPDAIRALLQNPDDESLTPSESLPLDPQYLMSIAASGDLAAGAAFLANNYEQYARIVIDNVLHPMELHAMRMITQQGLALLQTCSSALGPSKGTHSMLNTRTTVLRHAMADAALVALQLWALDSQAIHTPAAVLDWAYELTDSLGNAGALFERQAALPAALVPHLYKALRAVGYRIGSAQDAPPSSDAFLSRDELDESREEALSIESGLHHCLYWAYGVRLPGVDEENWGGETTPETTIPPTGHRRVTSQDEALSIWIIVEVYLVGQTISGLQKNKEFLETIFALFPKLPPTLDAKVDAAWEKMAMTQPPEVGAPGITNPMQGLLESAFDEDSKESENEDKHTRSWEKYLPVYRSIFRIRHLLQPPTGATVDKEFPGAGFVDPGADKVVPQLLYPLRADLAIHPEGSSEEGWSALALLYHEAADLLLLKVAQEVPARQWQHRVDLQRRVDTHRRLGHWCTAIDWICVSSQSDDTSDDKADLLELAGSKLYNDIANAPPRFDQITLRPGREDPALLDSTQAALRAYQSAAEVSPDEWESKMQIARCMRRLGKPPEEWLPLMAVACYQAVQQHNGLFEPIYTLHAARLKLLRQLDAEKEGELDMMGGYNDAIVAMLRLLGKYCFLPETQTTLIHLEETLIGDGSIPVLGMYGWSQYREALFTDGVAAMEWCFEKSKYKFHRAATMLAKLHVSEPTSVVVYLAPLFSKSKTLFTINMFPLKSPNDDDGGARGKRYKNRGRGSNRRSAEDIASTPVPETDYGLRPQARPVRLKLVEPGVVFLGRLRKTLCMYFDALLRMGNVEVLGAAVQFFDPSKNNQGYEYLFGPGFEDIRELAKGYYVLSVLSSALDLCSLETLFPPEEPLLNSGITSPSSRNHTPSRKKGGVDADAVAQGRREQRHLRALAAQLDQSVAERVLERTFTIYDDHSFLSLQREQPQWDPAMVATPARTALSLAQEAQGPSPLPHADALQAILHSNIIQSVLRTYSRLYLHVLATHGAAEKLRIMAIALRKRYGSSAKGGGANKTAAVGPVEKVPLPPMVKPVCAALVEALRNECRELIEEAKGLVPELRQSDSGLVVEAGTAGSVGVSAVPIRSTSSAVPSTVPQHQDLPGPSGPGFIPVSDLTAVSPQQPPLSGLASTSVASPIAIPPPVRTAEQERGLLALALIQSQRATAVALQGLQAQGHAITPAVVQFYQEQQYNLCLAQLTQESNRQLQQQHQEALMQAQMEARRKERAQRQAQQQQQAMIKINLVPTSPVSPAEQEVQDKVFEKLSGVSGYVKVAPWIADSPLLKEVAAAADSLRIELLRCYLALGHIQLSGRPTERAQALKLCDDVVRLHRKASKAQGEGGDAEQGQGQGEAKKQRTSGPGETSNATQ